MECKCRSIRTTSGYDVSEASIFSLYKELGGTKTMRQLDQVEKRLLRIIALQRQMEKTGAVGDFEKTISTSANELKQLSETFKEIGRWIGQLTMVYMQPFIEKVLAGAVALREMLKALNIAKGYKPEDFTEKTGGLFGEVEDSAENAEEAVKNLKSSLLGFDKLNILGSNQSTVISPDYNLLTDELKKYSKGLDEVKNKANKMAESILVWLGYTKSTNAETGEVNWKLREGFTRIEAIIGGVKVLGTTLLAIGFRKIIVEIITGLGSIKAFLDSKGILGVVTKIGGKATLIIAGILLAVDSFKKLYEENEKFKNSVDRTFASIKDNLTKIKEPFKEMFDTLSPVLGKIEDIVVNTLAIGVLEIIDGFQVLTSLLTGDFKEAWEGIKSIYEDFGNFLGSIFGFDFNGWLQEYVIDPMTNTVFSGEWWNKQWETIKNFFTSIPNWFNNNVWKPIGNFFIGIVNGCIEGFEGFINFFVDRINDITGGLSSVWTWLGIPAIPKMGRTEFDKIPYLAKGGVLDKPTMAMVGEYAGAKSNPEIVTPENLMREVFIDSMLPVVQAIVSGDQQVIGAIEDLADRPINLNGRKVSENIYNDLQSVALRKGKTLFAR